MAPCLLLGLLLFVPVNQACAIEDGTAFGFPHTIAAEPAPHILDGQLKFIATFKSTCPVSNAAFEATRFASTSAPGILASSIMLVAVLDVPSCASPSPFEKEHIIEVSVPLPASALGAGLVDRFIACPPGSTFEMMKLSDRSASSKPSFIAAAFAQTTAAPPATRPADWDDDEDCVWEAPAVARRRKARYLAVLCWREHRFWEI